jgi:hypothetical protein
MVRKARFISLVLVVVLAGMVTVASAAQNVANVSQKGSLLIWPKILAYGLSGGGTAPLQQQPFAVDTFIFIGNDYYTDVWVKCYWVDWEQQIQDFMFRLTPNQPVVFSALEGLGDGFVTIPPFQGGAGELKCWAVNAVGDSQIAFNHLYGNALLVQENAGVVYNAWSFTARGVAQGSPVGTGGNLQLTGQNGAYDACPQYLVTNFIPADIVGNEGPINPDLTLVPCKQDLRQDRVPTCTKAKFDIWNENETKFTGAYRCIKCWYEGFLDEIGAPYGYGGDKFTYFVLKTYAARFRVTGVASSVCVNKFKTPDTIYAPGKDKCTGGQVASPLLGVMLYAEPFYTTVSDLGPPLPDNLGPPLVLPFAGYTPHTAGADGTGFVLWDTQGEPPQAPKN